MNIVIGLGKTGFSCVDYFCNRNESVMVVDTREEPPYWDALRLKHPHIRVVTGKLSETLLCSATQLIVSPGISLKTPAITAAIDAGVSCVGDVELFAREAKAPIIAITASNGKTTLTTLVGQLLIDAGYRVEVCGNIGTPVLEALDRDVPDFYVVELSSFQLETTSSLRAQVAVVMNVSADHMDRYDTIDDYAAAKRRIYNQCHCAVINIDEPICWQSVSSPMITFSVLQKNKVNFYLDYCNDTLSLCFNGAPWMPVSELPSQGLHHYQNALIALAIGHAVGLSEKTMIATLKHFSGLPHRCQKVAVINQVTWYNDSKATNVGAVIAALNSVGPLYKRIILIAGGDSKSADMSELKPVVSRYVSHLILMGRDADKLYDVFHDIIPSDYVADLNEAVLYAKQYAQAGDAVLLSPACSSLDMFKNYEERGNLFMTAIQELVHE